VQPPVNFAHIRKIQNGVITTVADVAAFQLAIDPAGNLFVTILNPTYGISVQEISNGVTTPIAGMREYVPGQSFGENGPALDAILGGVSGLGVDKAGNVFIASHGSTTVIPPSFEVVRRVSNGVITTVAGAALGAQASIGDNGPAVG